MSRNSEIIMEQNENGEFEYVDIRKKLADRNEEIKESLKDKFEKLEKEQERCRALKSKEKQGGKFSVILLSKLASYGFLTPLEFAQLTYEDIEAHFYAFIDLMAHYNLTFEIVPNKQVFCSFMRINVRMYSRLEESPNEDICELMASINDYFIGATFGTTENGNADGKSALNRLTFHGAGHGLIKENEKQVIDSVSNGITEEEMAVRLQKHGIKILPS